MLRATLKSLLSRELRLSAAVASRTIARIDQERMSAARSAERMIGARRRTAFGDRERSTTQHLLRV